MPADLSETNGGVFNELIHAPLRFRICGLLRNVKSADFSAIRDSLAVGDAALSKHLKVLVDGGFVSMTKSSSVGRPDARRISWLSLTPQGRSAFDSHLAALRAIATGVIDDGD
ncbi:MULTISPECIES: transcriptional regulator [unclassified Arthrobacter]|uniref:transcriptional regulator n=1 Tax=unclassified Arthrobacter TaxID=235627 RepID=UPI0002E451DC|nr:MULTISPECIES: transcriptional regulator [unclassified Arthrobacter]PVE18462.1 transcriptional regulator [Arthrobacter sp. Bz4]